jgi:hypothetical protein
MSSPLPFYANIYNSEMTPEEIDNLDSDSDIQEAWSQHLSSSCDESDSLSFAKAMGGAPAIKPSALNEFTGIQVTGQWQVSFV